MMKRICPENELTGHCCCSRDSGWLLDSPIAHRGLHSPGMPENSLAACREAVRHGYAIELDVRRTRDNILVVFHDRNLLRMTGQDRILDTLSFAELRQFRLQDTDERIPTLAEVLSAVDGRTGLLIEIKAHEDIGRTELQLAMMLDTCPGDFAIASFDPAILRWFQKNRPGWIRGQIIGRPQPGAIGRLRHLHVLLCLVPPFSRPDFIACECTGIGLLTRCMTTLFGIPLLAWTVRDAATVKAVKGAAANIIFEGFRCPKR